MTSRALISFTVSLALGCGGASTAPDASVRDGGGSDVGTTIDSSIDAPAAHDVGNDTFSASTHYTTEMRTIRSGGVDWPYVLVHPDTTPAGLPLVLGMHPDGGDGPGFHAQMMFESVASRPMVYAYPTAAAGQYEYYTVSGRQAAAQLALDLIAALSAELAIDTAHVFMAGYSGGATITNAIECHVPAGTLAGVGIYAGTLYPQDDPPGSGMMNDFDYTASGGVTCSLSPVIFVWGTLDTSDVSFVFGQGTRDTYRANFGCASGAESPWTHTPCVTYAGCTSPVVWCPAEGYMHGPPWPGAGGVIQPFFESLL